MYLSDVDFAHPIEDAIEGVTHSICTLEFEDHRPLYDWVVRELEFENPPKQIEFAKLYLTNVVTGKRYIKKLVEDGIVDGWDDPRLVSIAALRRRGFTTGMRSSVILWSCLVYQKHRAPLIMPCLSIVSGRISR